MSDKDPLVALLGRVHEHLVGLSTAVQELAAQIERQQPSRVRNLLTEAQMAEYLGITKKALAGRRYRKDFPEEACEKLGGSWFYSVKAYEEWLERLWEQAKAARVPSRKRKRSSKPAMPRDAGPVCRIV